MPKKNEESVIVNRISEIRNLSKRASSVDVTPSKKVHPSRQKVAVSSMNLRTSSHMGGGMSMGGRSGFGGGAIQGQGTNIYSPHLSTDFLELPQNRSEQRSYYRHFYNNDPYVGQAIDLHTELPLSKIRLSIPGGQDEKRNREIYQFFTEMQHRLNLLETLVNATREYYVIGEAFIFAEDSDVSVPEEVRYKYEHEITPDGEAVTKKVKRDNWKELEEEYVRHNYEGWHRLMVLPPDQVNVESIQFSDTTTFELMPDAKTANLVQRAQRGDERAAEQFLQYPEEIRNYLLSGENIPLGDDPYSGSFVYQLARAKADYAQHGVSILQRCLMPGTDVLVERDGVVQCVPVEDVDERIDRVATAKGNFSTFTKGDRIVEGDIIRLDVEGQPEPLEITPEHEVYRVLDSGAEELVEATQLREGDQVREVSINPDAVKACDTIDFREWWKDRKLNTLRRRHASLRYVEADSVGRTPEGALSVVFAHKQDNKGRTGSISKRDKLCNWLRSLNKPVEMSYSEVADNVGLSKSQVAYYTKVLRKDLGYDPGRNSDTRKTVWKPLDSDTETPGSVVYNEMTSPIDEIPVNGDFMYLVGTWLGDGSVWTNKDLLLDCGKVTWTFGDDEEGRQMREEVRSRVDDLFPGVETSDESVYSNSDTLAFHIEDHLLARFFIEVFGQGSDGKHLPTWAFGLGRECKRSLLAGVIDTDGCVTSQFGSPKWDIQLKNKTLIEQLHLICNSIGVTTSVKPCHRKAEQITTTYQTQDGPVTKTYDRPERTYWRVGCSRTNDALYSVEKCPVKGQRVVGHVASDGCKDRQDTIVRRITNVERKPYQGVVYSFEVDEDESHSMGMIAAHNCLRSLVYKDKLRQSQTSIASRAMTPKRLIYAEDLDVHDVDELRDQVDMALMDPDFSIITNYEVRWEEISADQRLLNLSGEYDRIDRELFAGLGVTESMLTGDANYGAERINIEIINNRYMLYRDHIQRYVEEELFKPVAIKKGYVEYDEFGNMRVLHPSISFTRLAIRDNRDTFDHLFNLYQKGSLGVNYILELLNLDPVAVREGIENDLFTVNDPTFNEVVRGVLSDAGRNIVEQSDIVEKLIQYITSVSQFDVSYEAPDEEGGRF